MKVVGVQVRIIFTIFLNCLINMMLKKVTLMYLSAMTVDQS